MTWVLVFVIAVGGEMEISALMRHGGATEAQCEEAKRFYAMRAAAAGAAYSAKCVEMELPPPTASAPPAPVIKGDRNA